MQNTDEFNSAKRISVILGARRWHLVSQHTNARFKSHTAKSETVQKKNNPWRVGRLEGFKKIDLFLLEQKQKSKIIVESH